MDDGSTDGTAEIARSRLGQVHLTGEPRCRRRPGTPAWPSAAESWSSFVDDDDLLVPGGAVPAGRLPAGPPGGRRRDLGAPGVPRLTGPSRPAWMNPDWLDGPQLSCQPGAVLARRRAYDAVGGCSTRSYRNVSRPGLAAARARRRPPGGSAGGGRAALPRPRRQRNSPNHARLLREALTPLPRIRRSGSEAER